MDGKSLIGSYVCTDTPGEFKWQPGALAVAVMTGKLVLLEDIDKAPPDVLATLIPLLEHRKLPGKNLQHTAAHSSFKFIATRCVRQSSGANAPRKLAPIVQAVLRISRTVEFVPLSLDELQDIVAQSCPLVSSSGVLDFGVKFWKDVTADTSGSSSSLSASAASCSYPALFRHHPPSPRDFLRWGKRVNRVFQKQNLHFTYTGEGLVPQQLRDIACKEFIDVLFRCIPSIDSRTTCARSAAASFSLPTDAIADWVISEKPLIHIDSASLCIGRLVLPIPHPASPSAPKESKQASPFCHTALALRLMEAACACVQQNEPVLLTGETGELGVSPACKLVSLCIQPIQSTVLDYTRSSRRALQVLGRPSSFRA